MIEDVIFIINDAINTSVHVKTPMRGKGGKTRGRQPQGRGDRPQQPETRQQRFETVMNRTYRII